MTKYPIGHYAIKNQPVAGYMMREIVSETDARVKVSGSAGEHSWRKGEIAAVVSPEGAREVTAALVSAGAYRDAAIQGARVAFQLACHKILKGYAV